MKNWRQKIKDPNPIADTRERKKYIHEIKKKYCEFEGVQKSWLPLLAEEKNALKVPSNRPSEKNCDVRINNEKIYCIR